jgi:hypothetical protein
MVIVTVAEALPLLFVAWTVTVLAPAALGVPVIAPLELIDSPAGRVPAVIEKLVAPGATT